MQFENNIRIKNIHKWPYTSKHMALPSKFEYMYIYERNYCHKKAYVCMKFLTHLTGQCVFLLTGSDELIMPYFSILPNFF